MNEKVSLLFQFLVESEFPLFYALTELIFMVMGAYYFFRSILLIRSLRGLNMSYSQMTYVASDTNPTDVFFKFLTGVALMSYGASHAIIANTIYISTTSFQPYSQEIFRSISCASGQQTGCLAYQIGLYSSQSWQRSLVNVNFFNLFTSVLQLSGAISYGIGWKNVAKLGSPTVARTNITAGGCILQIFLGSAFMHPLELWDLIT
ncbi:hypothetical protein ABXZ88_003949 [Vibrio fluvialis]